MRNLESRLAKLEQVVPEEPRFLRLRVEVTGEPPLSEAEQAVLEAEEARQRAEAKPGEMVVSMWSRERARELGAPSPPAKEKGIQVVVEVQDAGPSPRYTPPPAEPPREVLPAAPPQGDEERDRLECLAALARDQHIC